MTDEVFELWLQATVPDGPDRETQVAGWRARMADPAERARWFVAIADGQVRAFTVLFDTGPRKLGMGVPRTPDKRMDAVVASLVDEVVPAARAAGAIELGLRLPLERSEPEMLDAIARTGGVEIAQRIEFRTELSELPEAEPGRLVWRDAREDEAVALLVAASEGTDDGLEPGEEPLEVVRSWLGHERVAIHVGAQDGRDVALICARADPDDGWSTLVFMGLAPGARGQGLGHEVQRHGLGMMRELGGRLYHGGTSLTNAAMRACFARQGCREFLRLRQFRWDLRG